MPWQRVISCIHRKSSSLTSALRATSSPDECIVVAAGLVSMPCRLVNA